jgi:hypothetical protein
MTSVWEEQFLSLCLAKGAVGVYNIKVRIIRVSRLSVHPSPSIISDNREYTVVPTNYFSSLKKGLAMKSAYSLRTP